MKTVRKLIEGKTTDMFAISGQFINYSVLNFSKDYNYLLDLKATIHKYVLDGDKTQWI